MANEALNRIIHPLNWKHRGQNQEFPGSDLDTSTSELTAPGFELDKSSFKPGLSG